MLRKVDINNNEGLRKSGENSTIRKIAKSYQKQLQGKFDNAKTNQRKAISKCGPNYDRDLRYWYD